MREAKIPFEVPEADIQRALDAIGPPEREHGEYSIEQVGMYQAPTCPCGAPTLMLWMPRPRGGYLPGSLSCVDPDRHF